MQGKRDCDMMFHIRIPNRMDCAERGVRRMDQRNERVRGSGRRTASRAAKLRKRKARWNVILLLALAAAVILLVLVTPKEPGHRASYSVGTATGEVEGRASRLEGYGGLVISEIMAANTTAVTDENGAHPDWVEIWNSSGHDINLEGVGLSDRDDSIRFLFPAIVLPPDGRIVVFCSNTNQSNPSMPLHAKFKLSSVGETVYLYDPNAYLIDSRKFPIMTGNDSFALCEDGWKTVSTFSPGYENTEEGHRKYRESIMVSDGDVVINEVMADPLTGLRDDQDELVDWIELYNTTAFAIPLDRYALSDNEGKPLKWRFPEGAVIPAGGYYIVYCTGKDRMDTVKMNVPHTNFRISAETETVLLSDSQGRIVDRVMIDNLPVDCSYGRNDAGDLQVFQFPTPSLPNNQTGFNQMDLHLRAMNQTGVYISEVMASNDTVSTFANAGYTDWIELYNSSSETVNLTGWGLSDNLERGRKWQFPYGTVIGPGEYKVVLCDGRTTANSVSELHASYKIGRLAHEIITLTDPSGRILDKMILPDMKTDISYGRTVGMTGLFYYKTPTPFHANGAGFTGYTENPSFSSEPGMYYSTVYLELGIPEGTQVYYTTDGSVPGLNSTPYNGERLELNFTAVIRARAFSADGREPSDVITGTFFVNVYHTLPVVSVVTDPDVLWNEEHGMLVLGKNAIKEAPGKLPFKNTVYRQVKDSGVENECYVEMYDTSGNQIISQGAGFSLMGDYSLDMPQKSMKFRAKSRYGAKTFVAPLFEDREYMEYKSFVLRNSGNDSMFTRLLDGFESRMLDAYGATVIHQAWKPVAVYLNGVYWGHMNLRERVDRYFVAQHEGLELSQKDEMDVLQASGARKYGSSNTAYKAMVKKIKNSDPAHNAEDLQYILDNVDVDNLFEYMALEMFVGNSDIGNTRFYRLKTAGSKWKWIWYDADYGLFMASFDSPKSYTKPTGMGQQKIDNTIFLKLLSVPEYKDRYLRKFGDVFQFFTTEKMLEILNPLVELITPEMELHWARWGEENDKMVISEVPTTVEGAYRYWEKRVDRLRNTLKKRPAALWDMTQNAFNLTNSQMNEYFGKKPEAAP